MQPVPFLLCGGSWLGCAVVPVMGALFQSRGWLPIVEAPGYFRHPTSILAMQLLTSFIARYDVSNAMRLRNGPQINSLYSVKQLIYALKLH